MVGQLNASRLHIIVDAPLERLLAGQDESSWQLEPRATSRPLGAFGVLAQCIDEGLNLVGSAPFAAHRAGADPGCFWMWVDPIHIELRRDHGLARLGSDIHVSAINFDALFGVVRDAAASRGAELLPSAESGRWLLRLPRPLEVICASPNALSNADVYSHRPVGRDSRWVESFLGEVQMGIHDGFPQLADEALAPNAVWLSGGGALPGRSPAPPEASLASEYVPARSLWEWAGGKLLAAPTPAATAAVNQVVYARPRPGTEGREQFLSGWYERELPAAMAGATSGRISSLQVSGFDGTSARFVPPRWGWSSWRRRALLLARNLRR